MRKLIEAIVNSHIWIGLAASSSYYYTCEIVPELSFDLFIAGFILFSTTALYNFLGFAKDRSSPLNKIVFGISSLFAGVIGFSIFSFTELVWLIPAALVGVLYGEIPWLKPLSNWRKVPFLKIYLIALIWVYITTFFPMVISPQVELRPNIMVIISQFLFLIAVTIPFDIRDLKYDSTSLRTIPQLTGTTYSVIIANCLILAAGILSFLYCIENNSFEIGIFNVVIYAVSLAVINKTNEHRSPLFFTGVIDGLLVFQGACFVGVKLLYVLKHFMSQF